MKMHMLVMAGAKAVDEGDCADVQGCFAFALHEVAQALGNDSTHWRSGRRGKT